MTLLFFFFPKFFSNVLLFSNHKKCRCKEYGDLSWRFRITKVLDLEKPNEIKFLSNPKFPLFGTKNLTKSYSRRYLQTTWSFQDSFRGKPWTQPKAKKLWLQWLSFFNVYISITKNWSYYKRTKLQIEYN